MPTRDDSLIIIDSVNSLQVQMFAPTGEFYSIDTPPPTLASLHIGHLFSYTQAEMIVRFRRNQGTMGTENSCRKKRDYKIA